MKTFEETKRDLFLTQEIFEKQMDYWPRSNFNKQTIIEKIHTPNHLGLLDESHRKGLSWDRCSASLKHLILGYSAGEAIESLRAFAKDVVFPEFERHFTMFPDDLMLLWEQDAYQYSLWLMGLAVLFGLPEAPAKIATWFSQKPDDGQDPLISALLARLGVAGFAPGTELQHPKPYSHLWDAVRSEPSQSTPLDRSKPLAQYLKAWYKGTKSCYWHDNHKNKGNIHFGYWAFETGLVALLYEVDDSTLRELTFYPKDLVDFARAGNYAALFPLRSGSTTPALMAHPSQPCPKAGLWFAPRLQNQTVRMQLGEPMPVQTMAPSGAVIWYYKGP
jgi:hypothetical protein